MKTMAKRLRAAERRCRELEKEKRILMDSRRRLLCLVRQGQQREETAMAVIGLAIREREAFSVGIHEVVQEGARYQTLCALDSEQQRLVFSRRALWPEKEEDPAAGG